MCKNHRKILSAWVPAIIGACMMVSSCDQQNNYQPTSTSNGSLSTADGIVTYLENVPAVRSVEKWRNKFGPGITINTNHYRVHTTLLEPLMLRQLPAFLESAYNEYQNQLPQPVETQTIFNIYLFATREQWEDFTKEFTGPAARLYLKIKKGAYYLNDACVAYHIGTQRTFAVLGHEGWHHFNSKLFAFRLPSWLDEGIACTFENSTYYKGKFHFEPQKNLSRLGALRKTALENNMIPLGELITLNPGYVIDDSKKVLAFYGQSYALVRFLREEKYGLRLGNYHNLLLGALDGNWPVDPQVRKIAADRNIPMTIKFNAAVSPMLFTHHIDPDLESIQKEYENFCRKIVYNVRPR